jgi:hypothetical protein
MHMDKGIFLDTKDMIIGAPSFLYHVCTTEAAITWLQKIAKTLTKAAIART